MSYAFAIEPGPYVPFQSEEEQIEQCKEWGLLSEKAVKTKSFAYKGNGVHVTCSLVGSVDKITAVIELDNGQKHCIHPAYLKEMQAANFGRRLSALSEETAIEPETEETETPRAGASATQDAAPPESPDVPQPSDNPKAGAKTAKEKPQKLQLPEDKVKMKATVKEFTTVPNHFSDSDDEVIVYESLSLLEPETEIGDAWSSYSATLKKLELEVGDTVEFEGKIVAKKLTKHPVPYKINNPSKLRKL